MTQCGLCHPCDNPLYRTYLLDVVSPPLILPWDLGNKLLEMFYYLFCFPGNITLLYWVKPSHTIWEGVFEGRGTLMWWMTGSIPGPRCQHLVEDSWVPSFSFQYCLLWYVHFSSSLPFQVFSIYPACYSFSVSYKQLVWRLNPYCNSVRMWRDEHCDLGPRLVITTVSAG